MRIDSGFSVGAANAVLRARARQAEDSPEGPDAAVFSRHAADIQVALDALKATPEVREDQVEELTHQLEQGTFVMDEVALAEKLLGQRRSC